VLTYGAPPGAVNAPAFTWDGSLVCSVDEFEDGVAALLAEEEVEIERDRADFSWGLLQQRSPRHGCGEIGAARERLCHVREMEQEMEQVLGDVFGEHANDGASSPGARSRQRLAPLGAASLPFGVHEPLVIGTRRMKRIDAVQRLHRLFSHAPSPNDAAEVSRGGRLVARSDRCCFPCALRRRTIARTRKRR